jgi:hypothetical protein
MRSSLVLVSEDTGGLHDIVGSSLTPCGLLRLKQMKGKFRKTDENS